MFMADGTGAGCLVRSVECLLVNIRSLRQNLNEFLCTLEEATLKPDILILTEIWIYTYETGAYGIHGYREYFTCQDTNMAGGVAVYINDDLPSYFVGSYTRNVEACIVNVQIERKWIQIIGIYRSPNSTYSNVEDFLAVDLESVLSLDNNPPPDRLVAGDVNIDLVKSSLKSDKYLNVLANFGYEWLRTGPTRRQSGGLGGTIIDHTFVRAVNFSDVFSEILLLGHGLDHDIIKTKFSMVRKGMKVDREGAKINWSLFNSLLIEQDFSDYYKETMPARACRILYNKIDTTKALAKATEIKRTNLHPLKPWITQEILVCIKTRNRLKRMCDQHPDMEALVHRYKKYRNNLKDKIRRAEEEYWRNSVGRADNPKSAWRIINNDIRGKKRKKTMPSFFDDNSINVQREIDRCNHFFANAGKRLAESCGAVSDGTAIHTYSSRTTLEKFEPPTLERILEKIRCLKSGKAPGWDGLRAELLKKSPEFYAKIVQHLVRIIFLTGEYPSELKKAEVIIIHKGGLLDELSNYRPISLLSVIDKLVEQIIVEQLKNHLEQNGLLAQQQYGFRSGRGTQQAVCQLQTYVQEALENGDCSLVVFLDYSRAFDTVPRDRLLAKLDAMDIKDKAWHVLKSYLEHRTQYMRIRNIVSKELEVTHGVPQGGTIAPILFAIYINDLLISGETYEKRIGYADDTCIVFNFKHRICKASIETSLGHVQRWSTANGLVLNNKKSQYITFGNQPHRFREPLRIHLDGCIRVGICACPLIENVTSIKYLGMIFDEKLSWGLHVESMKPKLRAALSCISKLRKSVSLDMVKVIYKALFEPYLRYGLLAYGAAFPTILSNIETLQNVCIRKMLGVNWTEKAAPLYARANILPLKKLYLEAIIMKFHVRERDAAAKLRTQYSIDYKYTTRAASAGHVGRPKCRLERTRRLHTYHYLYIVNKLPGNIRNSTENTISARKRAVRIFIKDLSNEQTIKLLELGNH